MYMNEKIFELSSEPMEHGVQIDDLIAPTIQILNLKGYITAWCCSGHVREGFDSAYIQFEFGGITPEELPSGWFWEEDGHMLYQYESCSPDDLSREIAEVMDTLSKWAESLPSTY